MFKQRDDLGKITYPEDLQKLFDEAIVKQLDPELRDLERVLGYWTLRAIVREVIISQDICDGGERAADDAKAPESARNAIAGAKEHACKSPNKRNLRAYEQSKLEFERPARLDVKAYA